MKHDVLSSSLKDKSSILFLSVYLEEIQPFQLCRKQKTGRQEQLLKLGDVLSPPLSFQMVMRYQQLQTVADFLY